MPKGPLDPNRLLSKVQDAFDTQPVEPNGVTPSYSKSLQKAESDFFHPDDLYLDNLYIEDLSSW